MIGKDGVELCKGKSNEEIKCRPRHIIVFRLRLFAHKKRGERYLPILKTSNAKLGKRGKTGPDGVTPMVNVRGYSVWSCENSI